MDDIKDTQKGDAFSKFVDAQHVRTDPFGKNRAAERLYRRVERIVAALYLLTRHIPDTEPLRIEIRSQGVALLDRILALKDEMRATESDAVGAFESSIRRLISLVRLLTAAGRLSFQNAETIIGALDELGGFLISSQRSPLSERVSVTQEDIMGDMSPLRGRDMIKDIKDTRRILKDKSDRIGDTALPAGARADGIVSILRVSGSLGIKEISSRLPDYSEKMIQRQLASLVQTGQVKKEGFKRWSKYSLA